MSYGGEAFSVRLELALEKAAHALDRTAAELATLNDSARRIAYSLETLTESHLDTEKTDPT